MTMTCHKVDTPELHRSALEVLESTYAREKGWILTPESQFPLSDLESADISWFVTVQGTQPTGVLRVHYRPPLDQYAAYEVDFFDTTIDVAAFLATNRIAEIGRFAVVPGLRNDILVAATLMRAATEDTVQRGFTHYVTDVFEDDPHSPYGFHTRVMGFVPVATHQHGELYSASRRITMVLELATAYRRLRARGNWIFRFLTRDWDDKLHRQLAGA